jgi:RNA polymerase nonessential primary-like sigma factor
MPIDSDKPLLETLACSNNVDPADILEDDRMRELIDQWLDQLGPNHCEVIARRFGLRGHDRTTLEKVGEEVGLTRERVRQIQVDALKTLRKIMEQQGLAD